MKAIYALLVLMLLCLIIPLSACSQYGPSKVTQPSSGPDTPQSPSQDIPQSNTNVDIKNFAFKPSEIKIKKGSTIIWTNKDSAQHIIISDSGSEINSPSLSKDQTYAHTFNNIGSFDYHCSIHPSMKAKVIVG
jgi:amicyanin